MITIEKLSIDNVAAYEDFLASHKDALFYYSPKHIEFIKYFTKSEQETVIAIKDGKVVGCLPMLSKNGKYGRILNSLPFYGSHGAILANSEDIEKNLLSYYTSLKTEFLSSVVITNPYLNEKSLKYGEVVDERIGQFTFFPKTSDELMSVFHTKTRNMVRKGERFGANISISNTDFDFLYEVHSENLALIGGKAKPREFFYSIPKFFEPGRDFNLFIASCQNKKIAALLVFYFKDTVEYYTPVIVHDYRDSQVLSYLIYQVMIDSFEKGFRCWNWGGTWKSQEGVYRFKSRWGAVDKHYYYFMSHQNQLFHFPLDELTKEYPWYYIGPYSKWGPSV